MQAVATTVDWLVDLVVAGARDERWWIGIGIGAVEPLAAVLAAVGVRALLGPIALLTSARAAPVRPAAQPPGLTTGGRGRSSTLSVNTSGRA
ncbi:MAG TPA: hypothetical protein VHF51_04485 [Solirubrobacteraceae bacterium]|nr:hypothetical protein [Solirubrobacteraceae bacterium]